MIFARDRLVTPRRLIGFAGFALVVSLLLSSDPWAAGPRAARAAEAQGAAAGVPDYGAELPRIAPKSPEEALRTFHVLDGFRMELVAAEPDVVDPVAICFDADGTMYAVEMRGYSEDEGQNLSRIRQLRDRDGDGRYETSTIFAEGLGWPTAVTCYGGGVFVAVAPDLLFLRDTDGDGRAEQREVVYQGFGRSNVQGLVNTFQWGPDQRIHGVTSSSGAELTGAASQAVTLRGRDFSFDPATRQLEATTGGGQHGMTFDDWGDRFVCANSDHIQQVMYEDRYWLRNPRVSPPPSRVSIASEGPQADVFRTSAVEPWRLVRTRLRVAGVVPGPIEGGGRASGYFTSATGITIYRGDAYPPAYRGMAFVADVGSNLIHRKRLTDVGIRYQADRIDEGCDFVTSDDNWFRPVQMTNGPDGCLYIVDMYREVIEHPASLPPEIKQHLDLTSGRDRGRIWRLVPGDYRPVARPRLDQADTPALVAALQHANAWHQETAARLLHERRDPQAVEPLRELAQHGTDQARWRALQVLRSLDALTEADLLVALADPHPQVRRHAVRLSEPLAATSPDLRQALLARVEDDSPRVRLQLAFTLGELPAGDDRRRALSQLAARNLETPSIAAAVQSSLAENEVVQVLTEIGHEAGLAESPAGRALLRQFAGQVARQQSPAATAELVAYLAQDRPDRAAIWAAVLPEFTRGDDSPVIRELKTLAQGQIWRDTLVQAAQVAATTDAPLANRRVAVELLGLEDWSSAAPIYELLLQPTQPLEVQDAAWDSLKQRLQVEAAELAIANWPTLGPQMRTRVMDWLPSFEAGRTATAQALESGRIAFAELTASQRTALAQVLPAEQWTALERRFVGAASSGDRAAVFATYREALARAPDLTRGRELFRKTCSECHRLEEVGHEIGPNLVSLQNRGAETILTNVLEPNREVNPQYINYVAETTDGRVLTGLIQSETATSIRLLRAGNQSDTLLRSDLETLRSTGLSLMPSNLEQQIPPDAMSDLIGFILSVGR